jgi:hypothetical protein
MDFTTLKRDNYAFTYALVDFTTGEIRTVSCDVARYPLKHLFRRMCGIARAQARGAWARNLVLANCVTNAVIVEIKD